MLFKNILRLLPSEGRCRQRIEFYAFTCSISRRSNKIISSIGVSGELLASFCLHR